MSGLERAPDRLTEATDGAWQAALDSLPESLLVLDHAGDVVAANAAWRDGPGGDGVVDAGLGVSYLAHCERDPASAGVAWALREVLAGKRAQYECTYPRETRVGERWFALRAVPFAGGDGLGAVVTHRDVTAGRDAREQSLEQGKLLDAVGAAIVATDLDGVVTHWSDGAARMYGWRADEVVGHPAPMLTQGGPPADEVMRTMIEDGRWAGRFDTRRRDGSVFPAYVRNQLLRDTGDQPTGVIGVAVDMTEAVAAERQLRGARDFLAAVTHTMPDGLLVLDADGRVTLINQAAEAMLGWPAPELLGEVMHEKVQALTVRGTFRPVEERLTVAAHERGTALRADDDVFQRRDGSFVPVAYSSAPFMTETGERGWVVVFQDITEQKERERRVRRELEALSWVGRIRDALEEDRFVIYAQPIIEVSSGKTVQHELLVRMVGPHGEIIAPGSFLHVAEDHGLIKAIDRRVFEMAMRYAAAGHPVEVNLSADSISDPDTFRFVEHQLAEHKVDPQLVVFEITETALIHNEGVAQAFIEQVRRLECAVALDDFGTGYGSFRYLKRLPVSILKIDQEFIRDLDGDAADVNRHVIKAIVTLAQGMGQKTVAEGVETETALSQVRELGVDYAQGYVFARPAPAEDVFPPIDEEQRP